MSQKLKEIKKNHFFAMVNSYSRKEPYRHHPASLINKGKKVPVTLEVNDNIIVYFKDSNEVQSVGNIIDVEIYDIQTIDSMKKILKEKSDNYEANLIAMTSGVRYLLEVKF